MALEKSGMARRHAKTGKGKHYTLKLGKKHTFCHLEHDPISVVKMGQKPLFPGGKYQTTQTCRLVCPFVVGMQLN